MLKIMENEMEIFRAWLHKLIKGGGLTVNGEPAKAKELAAALNISEPTLTGYHRGRSLPDGSRHYPSIPQPKQAEILNITGTHKNEMLRIGKIELLPKDPGLYERVEALEKRNKPDESNISTIEHEHVKVVKQFQQKELALEINQILLEIEKNNPSLLKVIKSQLSGLANECYPAPIKKRPAANDKE